MTQEQQPPVETAHDVPPVSARPSRTCAVAPSPRPQLSLQHHGDRRHQVGAAGGPEASGPASHFASYDKRFSYAAEAATGRRNSPPHSLEFTPLTDTPRSMVAHRTRDGPDGCRGLIGRRFSVGYGPAAAERRGPRKPSGSMTYTAAMRGEREAKRRRTPRRDPNAGVRESGLG